MSASPGLYEDPDHLPSVPSPSTPNDGPLGPVLVAAGAAGWGTENLFRTNLVHALKPYPIVLVEHVLQCLWTLPWLLRGAWLWRRLSRRALMWVLLSGGIGSSLGTVCYTAAFGTDMNKAAAAVLLNLQPVVSTLGAALVFGERIRRGFYPWAALAILAGIAMSFDEPSLGGFHHFHVDAGFVLVGLTIVLWGFATVAGRGAARELPVFVAAPLRLVAGLATTALVVGLRALAHRHELDVAAFASWPVWRDLLLLTTVSGALPLFVYFAGLRRTPAAIAGYCEMFYTVAAAVMAWLFLPGARLAPHQAVAGLVLIGAVVMLNRTAATAKAA